MHTGSLVQGNASGTDSFRSGGWPGALLCSGNGGSAESRRVPKSIYAIAGLGIAGCIMLSLMMKNLVQMQQHRSASPQLQQLLEAKFGAQLVTPLQLHEESVNGRVRLMASACVTAALKKDRFAETVASTIWQQLSSADTKTKEVEVVVSDERGGTAVTFVFDRPSAPPPPSPK